MKAHDRSEVAPVFLPGDPVPWFHCRSTNNPSFSFDTVAGRYVVLCLFGSAAPDRNRAVIDFVHGPLRPLLDDQKITFLGVSTDPSDEEQGRVRQSTPGIRYFWDFDLHVSRLYGAAGIHGHTESFAFPGFTLVLDPALRVIVQIPLDDFSQHNRLLRLVLMDLPSADAHAETEMHAPVLIVPRVLDAPFCRELIRAYTESGGRESGFMREENGDTVGMLDNRVKRRMDYEIQDENMREHLRALIVRRLVPEISKAFQFEASRIERYIVACYDGKVGGFFRPHRDNTSRGTAHRRFAVTINLNAGEYSGGGLRFPEFGTRAYHAPSGGAIVFSCSLLHEALPVTSGRRYATLPFLYDHRAARIRSENKRFVTGKVINLNSERLGTPKPQKGL